MSTAGAVALPSLREDLEILASTPSNTGAPTWVIHDPLQHRYFQIDHQTKELLSVWREGLSIAEMARIAGQRLGLAVDDTQVERLLNFTRASNLTYEDHPGCWRDVSRRAALGRQSLFWKIAHKYLFFKVPLLRPQRALRAALPYVEPLYTWQALAVVGLIGIVGLYLASRQWDTFLSTFDTFFSFEGMGYFALSLILLKAAHELGHAFTAARFGCRVPTMGIAFMVMMPLLYTDVTDAWRLASRRQRMLISAAGILVELALSIIATFLWAFLPDGSGRSIAFMIATTGWIMSLGFNLNPCMKFDGYYLLADLIGIDNLQPRAFALGRWKVRQMLLAPSLDPPERLPPRMHNTLILYAWVTWLYRLVVFTAIAVLVYFFCFKLLGIVLFVLEIWLLIARPIALEIAQWWKLGPHIASPRRVTVTAGIALSLLVVLIVPWSTRIEVPAVLEAADLARLYPPRAAKVISINVKRNDFVAEESPIVHLHVPEIDNEIAAAQIKLDLVRLRFARAMADRMDREESLVLRQELVSLQTKLDGLLKEKQELVIRSPLAGTVLEIDPNLHHGRWVGKTDRLALIATGKQHVVRGYVSESNLFRLKANAEGRFIPDDLTRSAIPVRLIYVARAGTSAIDILELASTNGGKIPVEPDIKQRLVPVTAQYLVELEPLGMNHPPNQLVRGIVDLTGAPESFLTRAWRQVSKILIRESGF